MADQRRPPRLLATGEGSRPEAFGAVEWSLLLGTATIWGSSYLWIELGLRSLHPGVVSAARVLLGLLAISVLPAARRPIAREDRGRLVLLGLGWFGLPMVTFPIAQDLGVASSVVGMLNGALPLLTTVFVSLLLQRLPRRRQVLGVIVGLVGLLIVSVPQLTGARATAVGVAVILGTMAVGSLLVGILVPMQQRYGALAVLRGTLSVALVATLPFAAFGVSRSSLEPLSLLAMIPLGLLSTGLAFVLWVTLVGRAGAGRGSVVSYLVPVVAIVLGGVVLGERVTLSALAGTALVILGAWAVSGSEHRVVPPTPQAPPGH